MFTNKIVKSLTLFVLFFSLYSLEARVRRVRCESISHNYHECRMGDRIDDAELDVQLSGASCRRNRSWGVNHREGSIWVDDGCRAIFLVWMDDRDWNQE